jgi:HAD superfamily hydrolase (TIGR01490 family)
MRLALFDLDDTLLTGDSDYEWVEFLIERGVLPHQAMHAANEAVARRDAKGEISSEDFARFYLATLAGRDKAQLDDWHLDYMREHIVPRIPQGALELLAEHRDAGDLIVLTTATNRFVAEPIAAYLAIEHVIATEPECIDGKYTGNYAGIVNKREGKVKRLDIWLVERGYSWLDFAETWFYSDSRNDIPLLNRVSRPVAVDPDATLAAHARSRGWPVLRLRRPPA